MLKNEMRAPTLSSPISPRKRTGCLGSGTSGVLLGIPVDRIGNGSFGGTPANILCGAFLQLVPIDVTSGSCQVAADCLDNGLVSLPGPLEQRKSVFSEGSLDFIDELEREGCSWGEASPKLQTRARSKTLCAAN